MAEGARLESVYTLTRIEGSNPSLTAKYCFKATRNRPKTLVPQGIRVFLCPKQYRQIQLKTPTKVGIFVGIEYTDRIYTNMLTDTAIRPI